MAEGITDDAIDGDAIDARVAGAVCGYARRLHEALGDRHHVASPLGAWLVLALAATAARATEADRLTEVLGLPIAEASAAARRLLADPHPAVAAAAAVWTRAPAEGPAREWVAGLPTAVDRGPIPSVAGADAWAREHTFGLVDRFPLELSASTVAVLTSALATRISWSQPFTSADAGEFRSAWRGRIGTILRTPPEGHDCAIVDHPDAGDLAVHHARAHGLTVTSVIAGADAAAGRVLAAAHDVASRRRRGRSLFELPLGDGPSWTVTESDGVEGRERLAALLPAWSAHTEHDLVQPDLGFVDAAAVLGRLFGATRWEAVQAAVARYHRRGFEAAAVTSVAVALSARLQTPGRQRDAVLRFDRPFAVVATTAGGGPWRGLPVFSGWITNPDDATEPDDVSMIEN